ncbi:MAG: shikimate kinase [bacterium]
MRKNLVLCGFMGCGKTSIGKSLSTISSLPFVDIDEEIEKRMGMTISSIFMEKGEQYFRDLEEAMIKEFSREEGIIIAVGGGALQRESNLQSLKERGFLLCLLATPKVILRRLKGDETRPLLKGSEDKLEKIENLLRKRFPNYLKADAFLDTSFKSLRESLGYAKLLLDCLEKGVTPSNSTPEGKWVISALTERGEDLYSLLIEKEVSTKLTSAVRLYKKGYPLDFHKLRSRNLFLKWLKEEVLNS